VIGILLFDKAAPNISSAALREQDLYNHVLSGLSMLLTYWFHLSNVGAILTLIGMTDY
jgi:hypothetical protein